MMRQTADDKTAVLAGLHAKVRQLEEWRDRLIVQLNEVHTAVAELHTRDRELEEELTQARIERDAHRAAVEQKSNGRMRRSWGRMPSSSARGSHRGAHRGSGGEGHRPRSAAACGTHPR